MENNGKSIKLDENEDNRLRTLKIAISEDTYRKIKSFGILLGFDDKEPVLFGNTISKLYDLSKDKISKEFI
ncbi:hypothetical protein L5F64_00015 [Aliarcobacter butzleri]|uniref:hypothetical protein n=1 Tax=Aliarcobacter butzleri TaxID=28197 RepID=UPI001EDBB4AD|nr:hypothetical protein [Aliarcobacter butzleri]MCG3711492.1 hypothetical protein [Aliarcobacter butzleri]MCG3713943.1 hypothetical protein [Aliarcobacter butzleri]